MINSPLLSFLLLSGIGFISSLIFTLLILIPFSSLSQIGSSSKFENAFLGLLSYCFNLSSSFLLIPTSITLSIFKSGDISLRIVYPVSNSTNLTFSGTLKVCKASINKGFLSNEFFPVKAFLASLSFSLNRLNKASLYDFLATIFIFSSLKLEPIFSSLVTYCFNSP